MSHKLNRIKLGVGSKNAPSSSKRDIPTRGELELLRKFSIQYKANKIRAIDIYERLPDLQKAVIDRELGLGRRGRKKSLPEEVIIQAYVKVMNEKIRELHVKKDEGKTGYEKFTLTKLEHNGALMKDIHETVASTAIKQFCLQALAKKGDDPIKTALLKKGHNLSEPDYEFERSVRSIKDAYKKTRTQILKQVLATPEDLANLLEDPVTKDAWSRWIAKKHPKLENTQKAMRSAIKRLGEEMTVLHGHYKPPSEWAETDILQVIENIDKGGRGTYGIRGAIRFFHNYGSSKLIPNKEIFNIPRPKATSARSTYIDKKDITSILKLEKDPVIKEELKRIAKRTDKKVGKHKKVPSASQMRKLFLSIQKLDHIKLKDGTSLPLSNIKLKVKGGPKRGITIKPEDAKRIFQVALEIFTETGMRSGGGGGGTGLASLTWHGVVQPPRDADDPRPYLSLAEKWTNDQEINVPISQPLMNSIQNLKRHLEKRYGTIDVDSSVIPIPIPKINKGLKLLAHAAGLVKYDYVYGYKHHWGGSRHKYIIVPVEKGSKKERELKARGVEVKLQRQRDLNGKYLTSSKTDIDMFAHICRAFHIRQLVRVEKVPMHIAMKSGVPWKDPKTIYDHYLGDLEEKEIQQLNEATLRVRSLYVPA